MSDYEFPLQAVQVGANIANQRFQRDLQSRQLAGQEAERVLRGQALAQEMRINTLKMEAESNKIALEAKQQTMLDLAAKGFAEDINAQVDPQEAMMRRIVPLAMSFKTTVGQAGKMVAEYNDSKQKAAQDAALLRLKERDTALDEARTGAQIARDTAHANLYQKQADTDARNKLSSFGQKIVERKEAQAAGDSETVALYDNELARGETITTNPDGTVTISKGPQKTPAGVISKVDERLSGYEKALGQMDDLQTTLRPSDVGVKGVVGDVVLDKLLPQIGIASADIRRMDNRTKLKALVEGTLRMVTSDTGHFSNQDRADVKAILPSAGMVESFESANQTINTMKRVFAKKALIDAKEGGKAPPEFALKKLTASEIIEAVKAGLLTPQQASQFYRKRSVK